MDVECEEWNQAELRKMFEKYVVRMLQIENLYFENLIEGWWRAFDLIKIKLRNSKFMLGLI